VGCAQQCCSGGKISAAAQRCRRSVDLRDAYNGALAKTMQLGINVCCLSRYDFRVQTHKTSRRVPVGRQHTTGRVLYVVFGSCYAYFSRLRTRAL
jgi:hypothetical protein